MNYCVSIGDHQYRISVQDNRLVINGEVEHGRLIPLNHNGLHMLRREMGDTELHLQAQASGTVEVLIGAQRLEARVEKTQCTPMIKKDTQTGELVAPMPGLVTAVLVDEGDVVERGQVLATLESMKMQMQMRADISGCVSRVAVQPGAQVEKGALLLRIV